MEVIVRAINNNMEEGEAIILPIKSICHFGVIVTIVKGCCERLYLKIESDRFTSVGDDDEGLCLFSKEIKGKDVNDKVSKMVRVLQDIKFNKGNGHFYIPDFTIESDWDKSWIELIGEKDHIQYKYDLNNKCCVCHEFTITKTPCNHSLCLECATKIIFEDDEDEIPCPMCRKCIRNDWCEFC